MIGRILLAFCFPEGCREDVCWLPLVPLFIKLVSLYDMKDLGRSNDRKNPWELAV